MSTNKKILFSRSKKKGTKKKSRNSWYENDSSDEFVTAVKAEDVGVGISKSQRNCSKGKQNLFAELSTSSYIEYESKQKQNENLEINKTEDTTIKTTEDLITDNEKKDDKHWPEMKESADVKKSESEHSDHSLVIDEKKDEEEEKNEEERNSDDEYNRGYDLDDLYREDSSSAESDYNNEEQNSCVKTKENDEKETKSKFYLFNN